MIKIAITPFDIFDEESDYITTILDAGWDYVHLRHPNASLTDVKHLVESIQQKYHGQLRLHGHFELINEFNFGGLHLNRRCPTAPPLYDGKLSCSCHSIEEVKRKHGLEYVTLSPICNSISKHGHNAAFDDNQLKKISTEDRVVALGGISPATIPYISNYSFIGIAVLGYLFNSSDINTLKLHIKEIDNQIDICCNS